MPPSFPLAVRSVHDRQTLVRCLALSLVVLALAGCRGDRRPTATQPLSDPPTSYPASARSVDPASGSGSEPKAATSVDDSVVWEHLGSWSGRGSMQTESFTGETGSFRIKWDTRAAPAPLAKAPAGEAPKPGLFKLTIHSSISGRPLQVAVDQNGPGADTAYINEDPRVFFAVVDASNIEWSFSVDEAVGTRVTKKR